MNELVPSFGSLAKACRDEDAWKYLNKQILLKSRSDDAEIRKVSLLVLAEMYKSLGEEMLIFFPETIPFLAELLEGYSFLIIDDDSEVVQLCQDLCLQIQDLLGEPIQPYFSTK